MVLGGKAESLRTLEKGGFHVPPFFVCDGTWTEGQILHTIDDTLTNCRHFAVRSSAEGEDGAHTSYAGHFYSAVGVGREHVYEEVKKVIHSFGTLPGSVIIQEFIPSETAGVVFSNAGDRTVVINATSGLCRSVVEGRACDEYVCNETGEVLRKDIRDIKEGLFFLEGELASKEVQGESLNEAHVRAVVHEAKKIEHYFNAPQDIEWCFLNDRLYILQSRPITRSLVTPEEEYFDSANIAESYSGIVLPLTCSFAKIVYKQVYKDFLRMSGVPRSQIEKHDAVFENLLGFSSGRMYYNMNNWYRMAQFVPGYKRNKANFELMITSNLKKEIVHTIKPNAFIAVVYPLIVLTKVLVFDITCKRFKAYVEKHISKLRSHNFDTFTYGECKKIFTLLETDLLRRWYVTLENDFFVMTYLGLLQKIQSETELQNSMVFKSKATEQVAALALLSSEMQKNPPLWNAVEMKDGTRFKQLLMQHPYIEARQNEYLRAFGGRFANELKLETIGIDEDIVKFLSVMNAYKAYVVPKERSATTTIRRMSFAHKIFFPLVLRKFKKYAGRREEFRLLRSNMFAITRSVFRRVGAILVERKQLLNVEDVFFLTVAELLHSDIDDAGVPKSNFLSLVLKRKTEYASFSEHTPPSHFVTSDGTVPNLAEEGMEGETLRARGVSVGVVKGRVRVMKEFYMPDVIDFDILVTSHTDPGWTSLIALSKGLIIEHGGVLSHASIVARELGIPAVIGVRDATRTFHDGQVIEINGSTGTITIS